MSEEPSAGSAVASDPEPPAAPDKAKEGRGSFFRELPFLVLVAFGLALLIKAFLVQAFFIPSESMEPTLYGCAGCRGDRVLVNKLVYDVRDVHRGEIVVFNGEGNFGNNDEFSSAPPGNPVQRAISAVSRVIGVGPPSEKDYIKRAIGVAGDRVACCTNGKVTVQPPNGAPVPLTEPYVKPGSTETAFCAAGDGEQECPAGAPGVLVPQGRLWVMGDNRDNSADSRSHREVFNGTVPVDHVIGRAFVIVWPFSRVAVLRVPKVFSGGSLALPAAVSGPVTGAPPLALGLVGAVPITLVRRKRRRRLAPAA